MAIQNSYANFKTWINKTNKIAKPCLEAFIVIYKNKIENKEEGKIYKVIKQ